ncbi:hypothetical protein BDZ45DRAFT_697960 [Acephala macrosclerotiorum]|nr:hypothetical protein BDZ45DRAFT_697960 [Acephala macrosclerotiorum]
MPLSHLALVGIILGGVTLCLAAVAISRRCTYREGQGTGPYLNSADKLGGGRMWEMNSRSGVSGEEEAGGVENVVEEAGGAGDAGGEMDIERTAEGGVGMAL